jgi:hypothetical protein
MKREGGSREREREERVKGKQRERRGGEEKGLQCLELRHC